MPRVRVPKAIRPVTTVSLRSYPATEPVASVPAEVLATEVFTKPPAQRVRRQRFGRALDMDRIDLALREAYRGSMRAVTDISRETIDVDPHLGAVLNKRFGAVSSLPWEAQPAEGAGVDDERSMFYAQVVREQLKNLKNFRQALKQLAWALYDGRACLEIKWVRLQGDLATSHSRFGKAQWAIESLAWIHPRRLSFGPRRELLIEDEEIEHRGNFSMSGLSVDELPNKFVYWLPQLFAEYPEREGLAPRCLYWSFFKRYGARERAILAELFGKPWRVIEVDNDSPAGHPEMQAADEIIDALGSAYTARLPRGTHLNVIQPHHDSGAVHKDIIKESDQQISKLVLGQTGTTDGTPSGLNNNQANVMQDEQLMILQTDAYGLAETIEHLLTDRIIALNFGEEQTKNAPDFILRSDLPADRAAELDRLDKALAAGLAVKLDEAYEVSGFSQPSDLTDVVLRTEQPPTPPGAPNAPAPRPVIVFPQGLSPAVGEQQPSPQTAAIEEGSRGDSTADIVLTASDLGTVITVNEARSSQNLGPLLLPDGQVDPDGELTISEFKEKKMATREAAAAAAAAEKAAQGGGGSTPPVAAAAPRGQLALDLSGAVSTLERLAGAAGAKQIRESLGDVEAWASACCIELDFAQPPSATGNPEDIVKAGAKKLSDAVEKLVARYLKGVSGLDSPTAIYNAINRTSEAVELEGVAEPFETHMKHSFIMGALDNRAEQEGDLSAGDETIEEVEERGAKASEALAAFARDNVFKFVSPSSPLALASGEPIPDVGKMALEEAAKFFKSLKVMGKVAFEQAEAQVRRESFTVARALNTQMVAVIHDELVKQIAAGTSLVEFSTALEERLMSAGFVRAPGHFTASHIETVFRTNTLNAYNAGRFKQASQPGVARAFPVWEVRTARDKRVRASHKALNGKRLLASDPWWRSNYPPFDFSCRCRVVSRRSLKGVIEGSALQSPGTGKFVSGTANLI